MPKITIRTKTVAAQLGSLPKKQRRDCGYGLKQLSIAIGLTIGELTAAENDFGNARLVNPIRRVLG